MKWSFIIPVYHSSAYMGSHYLVIMAKKMIHVIC